MTTALVTTTSGSPTKADILVAPVRVLMGKACHSLKAKSRVPGDQGLGPLLDTSCPPGFLALVRRSCL